MRKILLIRYYLEMLSVPVFAFLVMHLSGHGLSTFLEENSSGIGELTEFFLGFCLLILFIWIWHHPTMKKLVPCSHDHCHHLQIWSHLFATGAFLFHFFPESAIRYQILENFNPENFLDIAAVIGFLSHFLVDIIVMVLLSGFWKHRWQKFLAFLIMVSVWHFAFYIGSNGGLQLESISASFILMMSGFLLTMFIHVPHKPQPPCGSCKD